jgi:transcriptional regulator
MYNPQAFAITDRTILHELIIGHSFAVIASAMEGVVRFAYAPTLFLPDVRHGRVQFHLARANPLARIEDGTNLTLSFLGPHAYISPNWYKSAGQVPTWNYVAVEGVGRARRLDAQELTSQLAALAAQNEAQLSSKPWTLGKLPEDRRNMLLSAISGFEVELSSLGGKLKLSQNRTPEDVAGAIAGLEARGDPASLAIAAVMKKHNHG